MASLAALILAPGFLSRQAVCMISYSGFPVVERCSAGAVGVQRGETLDLPASASQVKNVWWSWAERFMS